MKTRSKLGAFFKTFCICLVTTLVVWYFLNGLPLHGLPDEEDIAYVEVFDYALSEEGTVSVELTNQQDITNARNMANLLHYTLRPNHSDKEPQIEILYHLKNGTELQLFYGEDFVVWNNKQLTLKKNEDCELFPKAIRILFFLPELQE